MIKRQISDELLKMSKSYPVVTVTGPRQSGKTTLVKMTFPKWEYFNLENPELNELALADPKAFLKMAGEQTILDEIQNAPKLLSYIQDIVDKRGKNGRFILTGSRQLELDENISQSLAGRTALIKLLPMSISELNRVRKYSEIDNYLLHGFYPRIYTHKLNPVKAYRNYFETYIQRDLRKIINIKNLRLFKKFVRLCAGRIGNIFVASNLANETGVSVTTIQEWISILEASFIVYLLEPYYENIGKRLIKSPKLYFYDTGVAAYLLGIENIKQMRRDPLRGALVENLVLMELVKARLNKGLEPSLYFYKDNHNNEIDILFKSGSLILPIEIKSADTFNPEFTKNIHYLKKILPKKTKNGIVVYTGDTEHIINNNELINYKNIYDKI